MCNNFVTQPQHQRRPRLLPKEPEAPLITEEQEEVPQRPEDPDGSMLAVKSADISSHCSEVEVEITFDTAVSEDSDDCGETSGGVRTLKNTFQCIFRISFAIILLSTVHFDF